MAALKEWMASMVGLTFTCQDITPSGPYKTVRVRNDDGVILVTLETPDGEKEVRLDRCFRYQEPVKAK